ncbi:hypothetical protein AB6D11_00805 [Vibrio splendidus]
MGDTPKDDAYATLTALRDQQSRTPHSRGFRLQQVGGQYWIFDQQNSTIAVFSSAKHLH